MVERRRNSPPSPAHLSDWYPQLDTRFGVRDGRQTAGLQDLRPKVWVAQVLPGQIPQALPLLQRHLDHAVSGCRCRLRILEHERRQKHANSNEACSDTPAVNAFATLRHAIEAFNEAIICLFYH
jgi:hypothetical protein